MIRHCIISVGALMLVVCQANAKEPEKPEPCPDVAVPYTADPRTAPARCHAVLRPLPGVIVEADPEAWEIMPSMAHKDDKVGMLLAKSKAHDLFVFVGVHIPAAYVLPERDKWMKSREDMGGEILDKGHHLVPLATEYAWFTYRDGTDEMRGKVVFLKFKNVQNVSLMIRARWSSTNSRGPLDAEKMILSIFPMRKK